MNVLKCEFIKLAKNTPFKITLAIVWIVSLFYGFMVVDAAANLGRECFDGLNIMISALQDDAMYVIIGSIMAALFICTDFENRTIQESITCGNSHFSIVAAKTLVYTFSLLLISFAYPLFMGIMVAAKHGWGFENGGASAAKMILLGVAVFFAYLPMVLFFVFTSFLVRKIGVSFAVNIPIMLVGNQLLATFIQSLSGKPTIFTRLYEYSLFGLSDKVFSYVSVFRNGVLVNAVLRNLLPVILAGIVWSVGLFAATVYCFKKRDLK